MSQEVTALSFYNHWKSKRLYFQCYPAHTALEPFLLKRRSGVFIVNFKYIFMPCSSVSIVNLWVDKFRLRHITLPHCRLMSYSRLGNTSQYSTTEIIQIKGIIDIKWTKEYLIQIWHYYENIKLGTLRYFFSKQPGSGLSSQSCLYFQGFWGPKVG